MPDADFVDNLPLITNTPDQAECLQYRLEQPAIVFGNYGIVTKIDFMSFQQEGAIFILCVISWPVHNPRQIYFNGKQCHMLWECINCYRKAVIHMEIWSLWRNK